MIINIRGTSGSGKSTVVNKLMKECLNVKPFHIPRRKQPLYYQCVAPLDDGGFPRVGLSVIGHYETDCGGVDTINGIDWIYELVRQEAAAGRHVIYEGLISQSDITRCIAVGEIYPLVVIGLTTSFYDCLCGIQERRVGRGEFKQLNPKNTMQKFKTLPSQRDRMIDAGVNWQSLTREEAFPFVMKVLQWKIS